MRRYSVSAIPITTDAYFFLPLGKSARVSVFGHMGAGYYFGKLRHAMSAHEVYKHKDFQNNVLDYRSEGTIESKHTEKPHARSWGYHEGLGLDLRVTSFISLGAEIFGRHVALKNWKDPATLE